MVLDTFGPFLIPVVVFVAGGIGYGVLRLLTRSGYLSSEEDRGDG